MTPLELEQCVLLASDASSNQHWNATQTLASWTADAATLLQVLQTTQHEAVFFYCLTALSKCTTTTPEQQATLWQFLLSSNNTNTRFSALYVRTKMAVVLAHLILQQPRSSYKSALQDLLHTAPPDLLAKTLICLHQDDEFDPCGIKDEMRGHVDGTLQQEQQSTATIAALLMDMLLSHVASCNNTDNAEQLLTLTFTALQHFASWVEMDLLLQERVMTLVFSSLSSSSAGVAAVEFLQEVATRGMQDASRKFLILQDLLQKLQASGVNLTTVDVSPIEVVIACAQLVRMIGQEVILLHDGDASTLNQQQWPLLLQLFYHCLQYDDIDVSGAVLPLASQLASLPEHVPQIMTCIYPQMKYPLDHEFDYQDVDEAEEEVYRGELRKLYVKCVRTCPAECLQFSCQALANLSQPLSTSQTVDIEAALRLVHHYCEGIRPPPGLQQVVKNDVFVSLLTALHQSDVTQHPHREVLLLYYDLSVRYYPIFIKQPQLLPLVLQGLSGERGLQHAHPRVRSRSCYLLLRLVKSVIKVMRPYVETAVTGIQGLLNSPNGYQQLRPDDALYLFETMGLLLGKTGLEPALQQSSLTKVIAPHIQSMKETLQSDALTQNTEYCGDMLASNVAAIAYLSKGFKNPPVEVQLVLAETVSVTLLVLEALPDNDGVRAKVYIFLQRMIQCIGVQVLPSMPRFLLLLIEHCTVDDIQDVAQLLNQLCIKFREDAIPSIDPAIMPFLGKCHQLVPLAGDVVAPNNDIPPHLQTEQLSVKKLSFTVLQHVVTYRLSPVLLSPTNASSLELVLQTMNEAAVHVEDAVIKKACLVFFRELVDQWITDDNSNDAVVRSGFLRFVYETFVPGMVQCMLSPSFNHKDAMQARNVAEFAKLLFLLKTRTQEDQFDQYVVRGALANAGCPPQVLQAIRQVTTQREMEVCWKETIKALKS